MGFKFSTRWISQTSLAVKIFKIINLLLKNYTRLTAMLIGCFLTPPKSESHSLVGKWGSRFPRMEFTNFTGSIIS
jgi:hypothetical protein